MKERGASGSGSPREKGNSVERFCIGGAIEFEGVVLLWKGLRDKRTRPTCWATLLSISFRIWVIIWVETWN